MAWSEVYPDGTKSVKANRPIGANNTTFIKTAMDMDHYWNDPTDLSGRHRFVKSPKHETAGIATDPTSPLGTDIDGVLYLKEKLAAESIANQAVVPFFKDAAATPAILELLGIRAMAVFKGDGTALYTHNIDPTAGVGIDRTVIGRYTITFKTELPSNNYAVLGGCIINSANENNLGVLNVAGSTTTSTKNTTTLKIQTKSYAGSPEFRDSTQAWFVCFGG